MTVVQVVLLANALPAFVVLASGPGHTSTRFVWTVKPEASVRLLAAMYGNAALLTLLSLSRRAWPLVRVTFVVFTLFSVAATILTFLELDPFLDHPRYFFVYWLVNYLFLLVATPLVFVTRERARGGRLPVVVPLSRRRRTAAAIAALVCLFGGVALLIGPAVANGIWPWALTPLVARIIGVWLTSLGAAFAWSLWDGDLRRTRPMFVQGLPTAVLVGAAPLLERGDLAGGAGRYVLFALLVGALAAVGAVDLLEWTHGRR